MEKDLKTYLKYYWLENEYLEKEVKNFFDEHGYLTPEHLFSIIIWKSPRTKTKIKEYLLRDGSSLVETVHDLTNKIHKAESDQGKLEIILNQEGFGIAMASAVLTILYPNNFTVYDYRMSRQLNLNDFKKYRKNGERFEKISGKGEKDILRYLEFVEIVKTIACDHQLSLRDCDRVLWAKSWEEELQNLLGSNA